MVNQNMCIDPMKENEMTPYDSLKKYVGDFSISEENVYYNTNRTAELILRVYTESEEIKYLVIVYSKKSNKIIEKKLFSIENYKKIAPFCKKWVDITTLPESRKSIRCETIVCNADNQICVHTYADGVLSNDETGETFDLNSKMDNAKEVTDQPDDISKVNYDDIETLSVYKQLEKIRNDINEHLENPDKYNWKVTEISDLKGYVCIEKGKIDDFLGKKAHYCYNLLENKNVMRRGSKECHAYRFRGKKEEGSYILILKEFLEGGK